MESLGRLLVMLSTANLGPWAMAFVFVATVFLVFGATIWLFGGNDVVRRRLAEIAQGASLTDVPQRQGAFDVRWTKPLVKVALPKEEWRQSRLRRRLVRAGYRDERALHLYLAMKIVLAFVLPLMVALPVLLLGKMPTAQPTTSVSLLVLAGLFGYFLPDIFLSHRSSERRTSFVEGFPDAMDMLVVCVEAGLGLDAAIQRVGKEIGVAHPELGDELTLVSLELRAGKSREEALRSLGERTGVEQVQSLASLLIQAEHFGTSIATALREHAEEMRTIRLQIAKERAAKLPVKLVFPIMFFIFPALFLIILGPAVIRIYMALLAQ